MATKTTKKGTPNAPAGTFDVSHQEVPFTPDQKPAQELKILTLDEMVELELRKLSPAEIKLGELEDKYAGLNQPIEVADKAAYKVAKEAWRDVQSFRTGVENLALNIRREYNTINKAIASKEGQIVTRAEPLEKRLQGLWKAVDDEQERLTREENERQEAALRARLDELTGLGMVMTDGYYGIGETITVDVATLRVMPVDKFYKLVEAVKARAVELQQAEEKRQQEEQQRQQQLEQERQQARLANKETRSMVIEALGLVQTEGTDELVWTDGEHRLVVSANNLYDLDHYGFSQHIKIVKDNIREFQETKKRQDQEKQERQQRIARENRDKSRIHALAQAGLILKGSFFVYEDGFNEPLSRPMEQLFEMEDKEFTDAVSVASSLVGERRAKYNEHQQEEKEKAAALKLRKESIASTMQDIGFRYEYSRDRFEYDHPLYSEAYRFEGLLERDDKAFQELVKELQAKITEATQRQAKLDKAETERQEKERQAGLNDAQRFKEYIQSLKAIAVPSLNTAIGKKRAIEFSDRFNSLCNEFQPKSGKKEATA